MLSGELAILEEGENSYRVLSRPQICSSGELGVGAPRRKTGELKSQNCSQRAPESPQAIAGGPQVPKEGEIVLQARNQGLRGALQIPTFLLVVADFEIKMATGEIEEGSSSALPITSCHVYEFDLLRSAGDAPLALYMSLEFTIRKWRKEPPPSSQECTEHDCFRIALHSQRPPTGTPRCAFIMLPSTGSPRVGYSSLLSEHPSPDQSRPGRSVCDFLFRRAHR